MKYTNIHNIPEPIYRAIVGSKRKVQEGFSVTELIKSPRQLQLERRHDHEMEQDVSEGLWRLLGSAIHGVIEKHSVGIQDHESEGKIETSIGGIVVRGRFDLYHQTDMAITDYKVTSVWSFIDGIKKDWEHQLNFYAVILRESGFEVNKLNIYAILRDWSKSRIYDRGYPQVPFISAEVPMMEHQKAKELIISRVMLHKVAIELPEDKLPECSPEEQWAKPEVWAVKKRGAKRAIRLFDSEKLAKKYIYEQGETAKDAGYEPEDLIIEHRPGEKTKCELYCPVAKFCSQYQKEKASEQPF